MTTMENVFIASLESDIPYENLEIYLEEILLLADEQPLDGDTVHLLKKLSTFLYQRYQIGRDECSKLQTVLTEELMVNSERLRTLIILRRDEKMYQDRLQKNRWLLERVRERGNTHIRIAREAQDLKRSIDEQKETIVELKKNINRLKKKCGKPHRHYN